MKRTIVFIIIALLLAGCSTDVPINTEPSDKDPAPSVTTSTEPDEKGPVRSKPVGTRLNDNDAASNVKPGTKPNDTNAAPGEPDSTGGHKEKKKNFSDLVAEFENEIELALLESAQGTATDYPWGISDAFKEMLQHRQSLKDVNEEMGNYYRDKYDDFWMSIYILEDFSDRSMNYRVLLFSAWYLPIDRMYIQIYDDEYFEVRVIADYDQEGGSYQFVEYCEFIQASDKKYLVIIDKDYSDANGTITYYLVNYEVDGKELREYYALKEDFVNDIWVVNETYLTSMGHGFKSQISYMHTLSWEERWEQNLDSKTSFVDNVLTITSYNDKKDEITLLFKDGYWEVIGVK